MRAVVRTFQTAMRALRRNVMRSALTCVGIIIGIAAVIATMEIGNGVSSLNQRAIASLGANNLMIQPGQAASGGGGFARATLAAPYPPQVASPHQPSPSGQGPRPPTPRPRAAL